MKKLILMMISIALLSACGLVKKADTKNTKSQKETEQFNKKREVRKPAVGDTVVAVWSGSLWAEGKVESLEAGNARIQWLDKSSPNEVELAKVFVMPDVDAAITFSAGDYALVKEESGTWWQEAMVQGVSEGVIKTQTIGNDTPINLSPDKVIAVTPTVAADIKDHAATADFLRDAHARRPVVSPDYRPKVGDHILGEWTTNVWYGGKVKSLSADRALIVWDNGVTPDEAPFARLIPFPNADDARTPAVDDFVLLKPNGGGWVYGRVTGIQGAAIEARDTSSSRLYKPGEFVLLEV
jgi:hypothetical protein